ncbi:hypothetical protein F511_40414 [Dorcoceras hygrometricum]|uniref:Uncharacterized protein n=1 Tax=Dorcoceras hygrometricum TaxID=472368 RepID=A0A2Z7B2L0_9LAMI|nr:hypothetical protein F511_40414 [Dorcoceras hygrometricum]
MGNTDPRTQKHEKKYEIEHAEPLGSLGLNGVGDDPADVYIPTGVQTRKAPKRKLIFQKDSDEEATDDHEEEKEGTTKKEISVVDTEEKDKEESVEMETAEKKSKILILKDLILLLQRNWAEICIDVVQFSLFGHLQPVRSTYNTCIDIVAIDSVLSSETVPTSIFDAIQHGQSAEGFVDFFIQQISDSSSSSSSTSSSSSSSDSRMNFSEDLPQITMPTVIFPSTDFTESTAQLRASIDQIQLEQVHTRERVVELKYELSQKITKLELAFAQSTLRQDMVFRAQINYFRKEFAKALTTADKPLHNINGKINARYDEGIQKWFVPTGLLNDR